MLQVPLNLTEFPVRLRFEEPMTDEQLMAFSRENKFLKIEREANGELTIISPTGTEGALHEGDVFTDLAIWARQDGHGRALNSNAGVKLSDSSVRAADAAWISSTRLESALAADRKGYARLCPEFVIEVRSKGDRLKPLQEKMAMWTANGAELAWLIDPLRKAVEVYRPGAEVEVHDHPTSMQGTGSVAGFELVMDKIWS
jgi:Uma2 family endonuclease